MRFLIMYDQKQPAKRQERGFNKQPREKLWLNETFSFTKTCIESSVKNPCIFNSNNTNTNTSTNTNSNININNNKGIYLRFKTNV